MSKLSRITQLIFGSTPGANQIGQFGSLAAGTPVYTTSPSTIQSLPAFLTGWFAAVMGSNSPAIEEMNALFFLIFYQFAYVFQAGIPEWDSGTTYYIGSLCQDGSGNIYVSLQNSNTNHALSDTSYWSVQGNNFTTTSGTYTVLQTDNIIRCDASTLGFTITLPLISVTSVGKKYTFKRIDASTSNTVTIQTGTGIDLLDGATTYVIDAPKDSITVFNNGNSWDVI
jgi:hypothetical protein